VNAAEAHTTVRLEFRQFAIDARSFLPSGCELAAVFPNPLKFAVGDFAGRIKGQDWMLQTLCPHSDQVTTTGDGVIEICPARGYGASIVPGAIEDTEFKLLNNLHSHD